ncbi:integral membrane protein [Astrocystis sublimbata]|nr:integral membrane protein [Astrocystis sublimbata]
MQADNLGPAVLSVAWVFGVLSILVVGARFYVRLRILHRLTVDDYVIVLALIFGLLNSVFLSISASWGLGQHVAILQSQPGHAMYTIKYVYLCEAFATLSPGFGRISYGFLLLALVPPTTLRRRFLWAIIGIQFVVDVATIAVSFAQCNPINGFWDKSIEADCWPTYVQEYGGYIQGSICTVVDLILAVFPASLFWNLHMEWRQKISLSILMGLGIFGVIASIVKTIEIRAISRTDDLTYAMAILGIWWTLEAYLVLIAVSIPTLRPIMTRAKNPTRQPSINPKAGIPHGYRNTSGFPRLSRANSQFESLPDTIRLTEIVTYDSPFELDLVRTEARAYVGDQESQHNDEPGIRKNIDLSVTYSKPI